MGRLQLQHVTEPFNVQNSPLELCFLSLVVDVEAADPRYIDMLLRQCRPILTQETIYMLLGQCRPIPQQATQGTIVFELRVSSPTPEGFVSYRIIRNLQ